MGIQEAISRAQRAVGRLKTRASLQHLIRRRNHLADMLAVVELRAATAKPMSGHLQLKPGEAVVLALPSVALTEGREIGQDITSMGTEWGVGKPLPIGVRSTHTQTVTIPTGTPIVIDTGLFTVTTQRLIFLGAQQTREWSITELIGFVNNKADWTTYLQVRGREAATGIRTDPGQQARLDMALKTACAYTAGTHDALLRALRTEADSVRAEIARATSVPGGPPRAVAPAPRRSPSPRKKRHRARGQRSGADAAAPPASRLAARAIDMGVLVVAMLPSSLVGAVVDGLYPGTTAADFGVTVAFSVWCALILAYEPLLHWVGLPTPGKLVLGIEVVDAATGHPPSVIRMTARWLLVILGAALILWALRFVADILRGSPTDYDRWLRTSVASTR